MAFKEEDRLILKTQAELLDGLAAYLGTGFEYVLHSFETPESSIIKIINGFHSGRSIGASVNDVTLKMFDEMRNGTPKQQFKCYFTHSKEGVLLKSVSLPVYGVAHRLIGLICINFYTNTPISNILEQFLPQDIDASVQHETFEYNVETAVMSAVAETKKSVFTDNSIPAINKNKEIISLLQNKGIFKLKGAIPLAATALGISKNTVYLHLRTLSGE